MSNEPSLRRADKLMTEGDVDLFLRKAYCGRLATLGHDGFPYICPLLFVWDGEEIWLHGTSHEGHLQTNVRNRPQVCFEVDEPGEVFAYGRFECDTGLAYQSVVVFGSARMVESIADKTAFFDRLMAKYHEEDTGRPKGFYPRLNDVVVYAVRPQRVTGKRTRLPAKESLWPLLDRTMSPDAAPPSATDRRPHMNPES